MSWCGQWHPCQRGFLPGYSDGWTIGARRPPAWVGALKQLAESSPMGVMLTARATQDSSVRDFWIEGSFVEKNESTRAVTAFRPALPLISVDPGALALLSWNPFSTELVGFAVNMKKRGSFFREALAIHGRLVAEFPDRVSVLYQDAAWLFFLGTRPALAASLTTICERLRTAIAAPGRNDE